MLDIGTKVRIKIPVDYPKEYSDIWNDKSVRIIGYISDDDILVGLDNTNSRTLIGSSWISEVMMLDINEDNDVYYCDIDDDDDECECCGHCGCNEINNTMCDIVDYKYINGITTIKWSDETTTVVRPEDGVKPDQYYGFIAAYAKKACGNTGRINYLFDKWSVKVPKAIYRENLKKLTYETEAKRVLEKRKAKKELWLIKKRAKEIQREYEARKLAHEKYGVPYDESNQN